MSEYGNRLCRECRYFRLPGKVKLFSDVDMRNNEVQQIAQEVDSWERERSVREEQSLANRQLFDYKPRHNAWCDRYTDGVNQFFDDQTRREFTEQLRMNGVDSARRVFEDALQGGRQLLEDARKGNAAAYNRLESLRQQSLDPVSGEKIKLYVLARYMNSDRRCPRFKDQM